MAVVENNDIFNAALKTYNDISVKAFSMQAIWVVLESMDPPSRFPPMSTGEPN